ncbi:leucine Rich Repeat protein [Aspergillus sclerotialis]|uniref:Leucine Rich Repeat protein n=1 Tax=Aspergillus sclerotialis TaxID=2070753 RepID=A0A3A2Z5C8_9EURO|nr:leucine Rich Repeat protein [Aspergillus sclerotialis]
MEIAFWIRQQTEFLRPLWIRQPYDFIAPNKLRDENSIAPMCLDEDFGCLDRTLVAYSASYGVDTSNIRYTIDMQCDDAPCFKLLPPASPRRRKYTSLELIAVMRALRYNEAFRSISFNGVSLDALQGIRDMHGFDIDAHLNRGGAKVHIPGQENLTVLAQEVRALVLKSRSLRRLDFSYSLSRTPSSDSETHDPGCGIPEAIFPVCRRELTNVDWVVLEGIKLGDSDLDYLVDAASQRSSHLRALDVGNCGLSVHDVDLLLSTIITQDKTLESINISGVQGRLNPDVLQQYIGYFGNIKKINLSRISRTSGPDSLITPETLFNWELEELSLSQTAVNTETVDAIATYLASDKSKGLRVLRLDQCGLNGQDAAMLLHSMAVQGSPRDLHLHLNENRIDNGCSYLFEAISKNLTPSHLSMRMIDFKKEEHFRHLVEALRKNRSLTYLDISKASLPYDAGPETCRSLQLMFEENDTLEDLDISGESAHLDVARFGIGLNLALTGLKKNKSLKVLRIEHQKLGLQGANTLASVLEHNTCLCEVYCENNDINLQSFTILVNGLQRNKSILSLSCMERDRAVSLEKIRREFELAKRDSANAQNSTSSSLRRSLHVAMNVGHVTVGHKLTKNPSAIQRVSTAPVSSASTSVDNSHIVNHDVNIVIGALNRSWDAEVARLRRYLLRNYNLAQGMPDSGDDDSASDGRPSTAKSLGTMLDSLKLDVTASANEVPEMPQDNQPSTQGVSVSQDFPEDNDNSHLDIFRCLDSDNITQAEIQQPPTAPFSVPGKCPPIPSESDASYAPSTRLAMPVPAIPPSVSKTKASSVRSTRSSSTLSTTTGSASTRSTYGVASSTLRGFLTSKERKKMEKMKAGPMCVSNEPPQLDWTPPKLDLPHDLQ